jgi:alkylation response protein AidB-like acyl-CoA dehydrogenase
MDFAASIQVEDFRREFRRWLDDNLEDRFCGLRFDLEAGEQWLAIMREWNRRLALGGYVAVTWPVELGGRGLGLLEQIVVDEELSNADAPGPLNVLGLSNIAPAIMAFGSEEQKHRFLPPMLRGDEVWCQGFSEPDAGSDLAALSTSAVRDGDHYLVNGQKIWNTLGHFGDWCELLVRTDPTAGRHGGISCLLVDMSLPGVEARPLVTITGEREFSEIFFTDVRVPTTALLGPEHAGWSVAMTTLAHERGGVARLHLGIRKKIHDLIALARATPIDGRPASEHVAIRRRLARAYLEGEHLKLLADRAVSGAINEREAGPETSIAKLVWSELEQEVSLIAAELLGPAALSGTWGRERLATRALTIAGGTTQVNKNIIAQRILGLPRG